MERNDSSTMPGYLAPEELNRRTAFHEAGHAAAIFLRNRRQQLPPIFFEIQLKQVPLPSGCGAFQAKVVDGNLIHSLPIAMVESWSTISGHHQHSFQRAYEADVVNLLAGPLAEAKFVTQCDGEVFRRDLISLDALSHYGGISDLHAAAHYLDLFIASKSKREAKMVELLSEAYLFVDDAHDWHCVQHLAQHILLSRQESIGCDEVGHVIERSRASLFERRLRLAGRH